VTIAAGVNAKTAPAQAVPWRAGLFGFVPLAARGLYADGLSPWSLLCWRYLFALVIILAGIHLARLRLRAAMRQGTWQIALVGVSLGAIQTLCYFQSLRPLDTGIAVAAVLYLPGGDPWRRKRHFTLRLMVPRDLRGQV
jgi:drug/metabolite transporter (DMT)-like permease